MSRTITTLHQFHHGVDLGDGVTNSLLFIQSLLRRLGYRSEIYAARVPAALRDRIRLYHELERADPSDTLLLQHHSMGHDLGEWLERLPLRRALVYHNITPPEFFSPQSDYRRYAELGREQLRAWRDRFDAVLAVSDYNADDLAALGYDRSTLGVIPLLVDLERLADVGEATPDIAQCVHADLERRPALLFVGRIVENKRQHLLLEALWHLQRLLPAEPADTRPMLVLAGGGRESDYGRFLTQRLHQLQLDDSVIMPGKVDDTILKALYRQSAAFVCASAHEGFGMPLVEAMLAECPVVALGRANIPHTLGEGGLILDGDEPAALAAAILMLLRDPTLRDAVLAGQRRSLERYQTEALLAALADWLRDALALAPHPVPSKER